MDDKSLKEECGEGLVLSFEEPKRTVGEEEMMEEEVKSESEDPPVVIDPVEPFDVVWDKNGG